MQRAAPKIEPPRERPLHAIAPDPAAIRAAQRVVAELFGPTSAREFAVRYWDGTTEHPPGRRHPPFSLEICHPAALRRMLLPPTELSIVEAYIRGDIDIGGDIERAANLGDIVRGRIGTARCALAVLRHVLALPSAGSRKRATASAGARAARWMIRFGREHTAPRDAHAVRFHYDIGNDFYALWLDRQMVYSCAYFARGYESLHEAQAAKLEHVCRKLRLERGERLLDIGCGWGALAIHAARHHGAKVTGITLSEAQAAFARDRVLREGVADRVTIQVRDYRTLGGDERFDKIASVGMVEHVGLARLPDYFAAAFRVLSPGGLFLNHGIVNLETAKPRSMLDPVWRRAWQRDLFIRRYVFPDGRLVPSVDIIGSAEAQGFELRDVESLREHYVETLRQWVRRLERRHADARGLVGDATYRVWRLYMAAAAHSFNTGKIGIIQTLLAKPDARGGVNLPRTRADLYST